MATIRDYWKLYYAAIKRFQLDDYNDISNAVYVKGSAEVWAGFSY
jgi:hypothetical protein